jgi:hypothetical protein
MWTDKLGAAREVLGKRGWFLVVICLVLLGIWLFLSMRLSPFSSVPKRIEVRPQPQTTPQPLKGTALASEKEDLPNCIKLTTIVNRGGARLLVIFIAEASAINGVISEFEFTFGDGEVKTIAGTEAKGISEATIMHTYQKPGTYVASVRAKDVFGKWSEPVDSCKQTIIVEGTVLGR